MLRLYKDGGIMGAVRSFSQKAAPLLRRGQMNMERLGAASRILLCLCETGWYAPAYLIIAPVQILCRKIMEADFMLRAEKEKPL